MILSRANPANLVSSTFLLKRDNLTEFNQKHKKLILV